MQPTNTSRTPLKYLSQKDLCQANGEITPCGELQVKRLDTVPTKAVARTARSVLFINIDCGTHYDLRGHDQVFQIPLNRMVVVVVKDEALLTPPDDSAPRVLERGIWAISERT
ncbi:MAG TPA: hypothetical protein VGN17_03860 [Bryobacteraceae bacterium]|jgi:hypothetical protein